MAIAKAAGIKSQTRRIMKPQPLAGFVPTVGKYHPTMVNKKTGELFPGKEVFGASDTEQDFPCPYGSPGDHLFGKESFKITFSAWARLSSTTFEVKGEYTADGKQFQVTLSKTETDKFLYWNRRLGGHSSMFMFKSLCRIRDEITEVRAQRLQDISAADAIAEGLSKITKDDGRTWKYGISDADGLPGNDDHGWHWKDWHTDPIQAYRRLWNSINLEPKPLMARDVHGTGEMEVAGYIAYPWSFVDFDHKYGFARGHGLYKGKSLLVVENPWVWVISTKPIAGGAQ